MDVQQAWHRGKDLDFDWRQGDLAEGLRCYRSGSFFEAHEAWESVWLQSPEPEKTFLQALIQVAAAFHHLQRNNLQGARSLLAAAERRLKPYPDQFAGFSLPALRRDISERIAALRPDEHFPLPSPIPLDPIGA